MAEHARKSDLVDIACEVRRDTPGKPSIAIADGTVTMPEWLAYDRGLI
jgi:hypothetical protein